MTQKTRAMVWSNLLVLVSVIVAAVAMIPAGVSVTAQGAGLQLRVLSNRPDMVSGGDVLIGIAMPSGVAPRDVNVTLNGSDVTSRFRADAAGRALTGLVTGLTMGANTLAATAGESPAARVTVTNHPVWGPIFSGPHEQPFICQTQDFKLRSGGALGPALDANCSIATRVDYLYRSTAGGDLKPLPDPKAPPADIATASVLGRSVPYVVRIETGTINRAVYQIAMLHDPAREPASDFMTRPAGWNGRLIYTFGGGCVTGWYRQGTSTGGIEDDVMLRQGYAVASASLNSGGNNCAELLAAETMMMVKERFIETHGTPLFTMGWGTSGGAYQQLQIADNYPGLLDGIIPGRSFEDLAFGNVPTVTDALLLKDYFARAVVPYTDEQKRRVTGFGVLNSINLGEGGRINATTYCPDELPQALRYDPARNPKGARCDVYDHAVNVYGRDPRTGFARRPLDNVGIQYGLGALNAGHITTAQFLELNEKIGGFDNDGNIVAARTVGDPMAIRAGYRSGRLTNGGAGLATTPIIDYRAYYDDLPAGEHHLRFHSLAMRARLMKANGHVDNNVMLMEDRTYGGYSSRSPVLRGALSQMDLWLTNLSKDTSGDSQIARLRRAKPGDLVDACWTPGAAPQKIVETLRYGAGRCNELYPSNSFPRGVAGGPLAGDIVKCQLKPIDAADYKAGFFVEEQVRLKAIFPGGVCDWSKPGVEQQPPAGVWQKF